MAGCQLGLDLNQPSLFLAGKLRKGFGSHFQVQHFLFSCGDLRFQHAFFFQEPPQYHEEAVNQFLRQNGTLQHLQELRERLSRLKTFDAASIEEATRAYAAEKGIEAKALIHPVRVAVTGRSVSPPLFGCMAILGREKVLNRLAHAAELAKR